ncbi:heparinase II/III domain-containing protein [Enterococcus sp. LJL128]
MRLKINDIITILREYKINWIFFRLVYSLKLKFLRKFEFFEKLFEVNREVIDVDIFNKQIELSISDIEKTLNSISEENKNKYIIDKADEICKGNLQIFSSKNLHFGNPPKWNYNPLNGNTIKNDKKWFEYPDFSEEMGDIKVYWEPSRFSHVHYLTRAYILTRDKKYYEVYIIQVTDWLKENPYPYGLNYKDGQECALRTMNILISYAVFQHYMGDNEYLKSAVEEFVQRNYLKIRSNFSYAKKSIKNNHTISEIIGMLIYSLCANDNEKIIKYVNLLNIELDKQIMADGGYIQYSVNYQRVLLQLVEIYFFIEPLCKIEISERVKQKIFESAQMLYQMQEGEDGSLPNYGSNDGAWFFPVAAVEYSDYRPVINSICYYYTGKFLYEEAYLTEESAWFVRYKDRFATSEVKERKSIGFKEAGLFTLKNDNIFIFSVMQTLKSRPSQMDQMHVDIWFKKKNIFIDSGVYSYASDLGKELKREYEHNTAHISGLAQMKTLGKFMIYNWPKVDLIKHTEDSLEGTLEVKNKYTHFRKITMANNEIQLIDELILKNKNCKDLDGRIYFKTPYKVQQDSQKIYLIDGDEKIAELITDAEVHVEKSYFSKYYLRKQYSNKIVLKKQFTTDTVYFKTKILFNS